MKRNTYGLVAAVFAASMICSHANPTGGAVSSGAASINYSSAPGTVTITQTSNLAIINWSTFSIASGETTSFLQPSTSSATLNRVSSTGGTSIINGTLSSYVNGTTSPGGAIYLINGNGIIIGPGGVVNAGGFTASTRDIADTDFLNGNLHFTGNNANGVQNNGTINALGGNVYLIGKTVDNEGAINAASGTAGLVSGDDVLLAQQNADGSTVTVNPSTSATSAPTQTAVNNGVSGTINAVSAELQAANGNLYALAINNGGTIRANTVSHQGGHIYLTSTSGGGVVNSGTLDASATAAGGQGGSVAINNNNNNGTVTDSGSILAKGGQGGAGGSAQIIAQLITYTGNTDLTAPGGTTGTLLLAPDFITIATTGQSQDYTSVFTPAELESTLATANVLLGTDDTDPLGSLQGSISINSPLTWSSGSTLTFGATGAVYLNGDIIAPNGGIGIAADMITSGSSGDVNPAGVSANILLNNFTLFAGNFVQNSSTLPGFQVTSPLVLGGQSEFLRSGGGNGTATNPYILVDSPGVAGIPTFPTGTYYVIDFGNNPSNIGTPVTVYFDPEGLLSFDANTSKSAPTLLSLTFDPNGAPTGSSSENDPDGDGGAINDGHGSKKGTNIASGSSTSGFPSPSRLLTAGSGINAIFNGGVYAVKPPPFVTQELDAILSLDGGLQGSLGGAASGTH